MGLQDADAQTVQVNLGDIPGSLVGLGRPPLPAGAKALAEAAQLPGPDPPQSPRDATVMEHRVAGDLVMGKMNKSMKQSMARSKSKRKKGSHKSDGSARSRKSLANSDLQVPPDSMLAAELHKLLSILLALGITSMSKPSFTLYFLLYVSHLFLARRNEQRVVMHALLRPMSTAAACQLSSLNMRPRVALVISTLHCTHAQDGRHCMAVVL